MTRTQLYYKHRKLSGECAHSIREQHRHRSPPSHGASTHTHTNEHPTALSFVPAQPGEHGKRIMHTTAAAALSTSILRELFLDNKTPPPPQRLRGRGGGWIGEMLCEFVVQFAGHGQLNHFLESSSERACVCFASPD